jgi:hypothetical protein
MLSRANRPIRNARMSLNASPDEPERLKSKPPAPMIITSRLVPASATIRPGQRAVRSA